MNEQNKYSDLLARYDAAIDGIRERKRERILVYVIIAYL